MEFIALKNVVFAGFEEGVSQKSGKNYGIIRIMEAGTGKQMEFFVMDQKEINDYRDFPPFTPISVTLKLEKGKEGLRAFLKELKAVKK